LSLRLQQPDLSQICVAANLVKSKTTTVDPEKERMKKNLRLKRENGESVVIQKAHVNYNVLRDEGQITYWSDDQVLLIFRNRLGEQLHSAAKDLKSALKMERWRQDQWREA
jgi:hypothetical protein